MPKFIGEFNEKKSFRLRRSSTWCGVVPRQSWVMVRFFVPTSPRNLDTTVYCPPSLRITDSGPFPRSLTEGGRLGRNLSSRDSFGCLWGQDRLSTEVQRGRTSLSSCRQTLRLVHYGPGLDVWT